MIESRDAETNRYGTQMKRNHQIVPRRRVGVLRREGSIHVPLAQNRKDSRKQMAIYIDAFVVEIGPAFETGLDVVRDGAVPVADAVVVLIPRRDLVVRQEAVLGFALLLLGRGGW